ncbi:MAG: hydrogenase expression/formation protein HypE, partial [Deltaproteobacteria bacterium]|nr:hydrogenase expression/formation protein HypE [Deltaproteobacteria bacterium]
MQCALPMSKYPIITLAHGGGGKLTAELIDKVFRPLFKNDFLAQEHDGAVIELQKGKLAFTTDSFVVSPIVFPGGDIGKLAVTGTINDLAMCGAKPLYMSCGFILEEGLKTETLFQIVQSMAKEAKAENIHIVTGDTKVVNQGKGDQIYINTSGIGIIEHTQIIGPYSIRAGDQILLSSDVGRHGMAILSLREGLEF